jgi:predicted metal-binding membrane protein
MIRVGAVAWVALAAWALSPYASYLDHGSWMRLGLASALCSTTIREGGLPLALYGAGWTVMCAAMMLPTTAPLVAAWQRLNARRGDRAFLTVLLAAGYLAAWFAFGIAAHGLDAALRALAQSSAWLMLNGWIVGAVVLAAAGLFQFSGMKHRCLDGCRSPLAFALEAWRRPRRRLQAWKLGLRHGAYCVGCCCALMLVMFVVGMANLAWMALLAAVMAAEKNLAGGAGLGPWIGGALLAGSAALAAVHAWSRL